nr:MAG TPA: hypothetical protein [Caudoviricetes sp.]
MTETIIRVYTGIVKTIRKPDWKTRQTGYYELAYKEFDAETGELIGEGTEDFTGERMCEELGQYEILLRDDVRNGIDEPRRWIYVSKNQGYPAIAARFVYGEEVLRVKRIH